MIKTLHWLTAKHRNERGVQEEYKSKLLALQRPYDGVLSNIQMEEATRDGLLEKQSKRVLIAGFS